MSTIKESKDDSFVLSLVVSEMDEQKGVPAGPGCKDDERIGTP